MVDRKGYNGLRNGPAPFGGVVHDLGANRQPTKEQLQGFISQQLSVLSREIYVRAAADMMRDPDGVPPPHYFQLLAKKSQIAAQSYLEAQGIQFEPEQTDSEPATNEA